MIPRHKYRKENRRLWEECEQQLDRIIKAADHVRKFDRILLVGPNASGKSLFRKLLPKRMDIVMVHASMELRTSRLSHMGALAGIMADDREDPTSYSTFQNVERAISSADAYLVDGKRTGLHIDEPEIGYSEEMQAGAGIWLRKKLDSMLCAPAVTIVTTHSKLVAKAFADWNFLDMGFRYETATDWIKRRISPVDPESILERSRCMSLVIAERQEANKRSTS